MSQSKKVLHPRNRACIRCGAQPGEPCVLPTGKKLELIHCTERVVGHPIEPSTWKPPQPGRDRPPGKSPGVGQQPQRASSGNTSQDANDLTNPAPATPQEEGLEESSNTPVPVGEKTGKTTGDPDRTIEKDVEPSSEVEEPDALAASPEIETESTEDPLRNLVIDSTEDFFAAPATSKSKGAHIEPNSKTKRKNRERGKRKPVSVEPTLF